MTNNTHIPKMGKAVEIEQSRTQNISSSTTDYYDDQPTTGNAQNRRWVRFRCVLFLLLGVSVLLSAVFWLPPFFHRGDQGDLDLDDDSIFRGHDIVASFKVDKPVSLLEDNIMQLRDDILGEIGAPTTKVEIISIETIAGSNVTKVVFGVDPNEKGSRISSADKSLIRASFVSVVIRQSSLSLTPSLFGDPFSFEVLKFVGGITVSPQQSAFPLQQAQINFNFSLNFSIDQIQNDFNELTSQLKSGLHLAPFENLYISLANWKGSTVVPPTTVQASVLLAVGNSPIVARLKQLTQTIKDDSHAKNLGLNNTEFGRVKQVRLSSVMPRSPNGGNSDSGSPSPSPTPLPRPHHHHHRYPHDVHLPPAMPPAPASKKGRSETKKASPPSLPPVPAAAPLKGHGAKPPGCHFRYRNRNKHSQVVASPVSPPQSAPTPHLQVHPPMPVSNAVPVSSPLPHIVFAHTQPPSRSPFDAEPPDITPSVLPLHSSASAGVGGNQLWAIPVFLVLALHL